MHLRAGSVSRVSMKMTVQKHGKGVCRSSIGRLTMGSRVRKSRYGMPNVSTKLCLSAYEHQASVAYIHSCAKFKCR